MQIGNWYSQTFVEKTIYFYVVKQQKNGGFAGIQVDYYGTRYKPHVKKSSVPNTPHNKLLWSVAVNVPDSVKESIPSDNG